MSSSIVQRPDTHPSHPVQWAMSMSDGNATYASQPDSLIARAADWHMASVTPPLPALPHMISALFIGHRITPYFIR